MNLLKIYKEAQINLSKSSTSPNSLVGRTINKNVNLLKKTPSQASKLLDTSKWKKQTGGVLSNLNKRLGLDASIRDKLYASNRLGSGKIKPIENNINLPNGGRVNLGRNTPQTYSEVARNRLSNIVDSPIQIS